MERGSRPPIHDAQGEAIRSMPRYQRDRLFGAAFNDLIAIQQVAYTGEIIDQVALEASLVGKVLRMRRLGLTPKGFGISITEAEDGSFIRVGLTRENYYEPLVFDLDLERKGRDPFHQQLIEKTLRSHRNNGKPSTTIPKDTSSAS